MGSVFIMKKIIVFSIHFFNATVCKYDEISEKRGSKMPPQTINLNRYLVRNHLSLVPSTFFMTFFFSYYHFDFALFYFRSVICLRFVFHARFQLSQTPFKLNSFYPLLYFDFIIFNFNPALHKENA